MNEVQLVADLMDNPAFGSDQEGMLPGGVASFLRQVIETHFGSNAALLARGLGIAKSTLFGWMYGGNLPTFIHVLTVARVFRCSLLDVLQGHAQLAMAPLFSNTRMDRGQVRRPPHNWLKIREGVEEITHKSNEPDGPPTCAEVAKRFGVDRSSLAAYCPELYSVLLQRR